MAAEHDLERDVAHLRDVQYRDSRQLAKRANLHVKYRSAPVAAFDWFAALVDWPGDDGRVLDVGCGGGYLWEHVAAVAGGFALTLTDLSPGMVSEAVTRATRTGRFAAVSGRPADARSLPFEDSGFDLVVSTYALYHVPEPASAVDELARVLSDGGSVALMTNGPGHLAELERIRVAVLGPEAAWGVNEAFSPAVALPILAERFDEVAWHRYDDTLHVTDIDDLMAFITSTPVGAAADEDQVARLRELVAVEMQANRGVVRVSKHTGAIVCRRPRRGPSAGNRVV